MIGRKKVPVGGSFGWGTKKARPVAMTRRTLIIAGFEKRATSNNLKMQLFEMFPVVILEFDF